MVSSPVSSNLHSQIHLHLEKLLMLSHFLCYNISHHIPLMLQLFNSHLMVGGGEAKAGNHNSSQGSF